MAFVQVVPVTLNITLSKGAAQAFQTGNVKNFAAANVNLSAWTALTATIIPALENPASADSTFGTVSADANGIVTITVAAADFATKGVGTCRYQVTGKPTAPDDAQLLASGLLTVNLG